MTETNTHIKNKSESLDLGVTSVPDDNEASPPSPRTETNQQIEKLHNEQMKAKKAKKRKCIIIIVIIFIIVAAGTTLGLYFGLTKPTIPIQITFKEISDNSNARRLGQAYGLSISNQNILIHELSYALTEIRLCSSKKRESYQFNGKTYFMETPDYNTCSKDILPNGKLTRPQHMDNKLNRENSFCQKAVEARNKGQYQNFLNYNEVQQKLNSKFGVEKGTYWYTEVAFFSKVYVNAEVMIFNGSGHNMTLYTKKCGENTCESPCRAYQNVGNDCPYGTESINNIINSDTHIKKCDGDMRLGPSELVAAIPPDGSDSKFVKLFDPIIVKKEIEDDKESNYQLMLAYTTQYAISGQAENPAFYGITDGYFNIVISPLQFIPIFFDSKKFSIVKYQYEIYVRDNVNDISKGYPMCMDGTTFGEGRDCIYRNCTGKCHPTHLWSDSYIPEGMGNTCNSGTTSSQFCEPYGELTMKMDPSITKLGNFEQEFNIVVDIFFYKSIKQTAKDIEQEIKPRAASIQKYRPNDVDVRGDLRFSFFDVDITGFSLDEISNTIDIDGNLYGQGNIPFIKNMDLIKDLSNPNNNGTATAIVFLQDQKVRPYWPESNCAQNEPNPCFDSMNTALYWKFPMKLVSIDEV